MTHNELMADVLRRNLETLKFILSDFSDADMLVRPCPGANHAAWQLGHLAASEPHLVGMIDPAAGAKAAAVLPPGFADKFNQQTTAVDDPGAFPKKDEILAVLDKSRAATIEFIQALPPEQRARPTPEKMQSFVPTVGHFAPMIAEHAMMHVGQFQVIRRRLGKPVLF